MVSDFNNKTLDDLIERYENDKDVTNGIKIFIRDKKGLDHIAVLPIDLSIVCHGKNKDVFNELLRTKIMAQSMLNRYYNNEFDRKCYFLKPIEDQYIADYDIDAINVDKVTSIILRYLILFRILSNTESDSGILIDNKKRTVVEKCDYCDNNINIDEIQCTVCLAHVDSMPRRTRKYEVVNNIGTKVNEREPITESSDKTIADHNPSVCVLPPSRGWRCSECTFINILSDDVCATCSERRPGNNRRNNILNFKDTWTCHKCTFVNNIENKSCGACITPHKVDPSDEDSSGNYHLSTTPTTINRSCKQCSFLNDRNSGKCEVCGYKMDDIEEDVEDLEASDVCSEIHNNSSSISDSTWINIKCDKCICCKNTLCQDVQVTCKRCIGNTYTCSNRWCLTTNHRDHCYRCKLKKWSNIMKIGTVSVHDGNQYRDMWQCPLCGSFNSSDNCCHCKRSRTKIFFETLFK